MLQDKVALVTGATRGIGKAIATALADDGAIVVGTSRSETGANAITESLRQDGRRGMGIAMDVTSQESIDDALKKIQADFSTPLIVVNNAGITQDNIMLRMKEEEWDVILDTNLKSIFRLTKATLKGMVKARWGRIISIGSVVGMMGNLGQANYAAAKAGLIGYSKSLAREVGSRGITVNVVAPGFIQTEMTDALSEEHRAFLHKQIPLGRMGQAEEVAHAVSFLASPLAAYITGETLHVNGGMLMS